MATFVKPMLFSLLLLGVCAARAAETQPCATAAPFKSVASQEAARYDFADILSRTTSVGKGGAVALASKHKNANRLTLFNFWASWCKPCRDELPFLQSLSQARLADVVLINVGDSEEVAKTMLVDLGIDELPTQMADEDILSALELHGLPATVVFTDKRPTFLGMGKLKNKIQLNQWLRCIAKH